MIDLLFSNPITRAISETLVEATLPPVPGITPEKLHTLMTEGGNASLLLLDVREPEEFKVSHIENALQVEPELTADEFRERFRGKAQGKTIIVYCSVGQRSALLLQRIDKESRKAGASGIFNLTGGIFRWYNIGFPVVNAEGRTADIHPFNPIWSLLLISPKKHLSIIDLP